MCGECDMRPEERPSERYDRDRADLVARLRGDIARDYAAELRQRVAGIIEDATNPVLNPDTISEYLEANPPPDVADGGERIVREWSFGVNYRDGITTSVDIHYDWRDRIRILIHGWARVILRTETENVVGAIRTETTILVPSFEDAGRMMKRRRAQGTPERDKPGVWRNG